VAVLSLIVPVILAEPIFTAFTIPFESTVATAGLLLVHEGIGTADCIG
jgi:hypothetical protein